MALSRIVRRTPRRSVDFSYPSLYSLTTATDAAPQGTQDEANVAPVYQGSTDATSLDLSNTYTDFDAAVEAARVAPSGDEVDDPSNLKAPDGYDLIFGPLSRANNAPGVRITIFWSRKST